MMTHTEQEIKRIVTSASLEESIKNLTKPEWVNSEILRVIDAIDAIRTMYPGINRLRKSAPVFSSFHSIKVG